MPKKKSSARRESLGSSRSAKQPLTDEQKEQLRTNWLAPAGSAQEKRLLKAWVSKGKLGEKDRALIHEWIHQPDGFELRNQAFTWAAKKSILGDVAWETAIERHKGLPWREWIVACLTTRGIPQPEIAALIDRHERSVDNIVMAIKQKVTQELGCEVESVRLVEIARWFLGL
jgi:hypothetical protein